jgi:hypothetical protein
MAVPPTAVCCSGRGGYEVHTEGGVQRGALFEGRKGGPPDSVGLSNQPCLLEDNSAVVMVRLQWCVVACQW